MKNTAKKIVAGTVGAASLFLASAATANADSVHHVVKNDTVWALSQKYGVSIKSIEQLNHIDSNTNMIYVGQDLQIPGKTAQTPKQHNARTYVVKEGDSLWVIAQKFHTSVEHLRQLNGLTSSTIYVGQTLKIDGQVAPVASAKTTTTARTQQPTVKVVTKTVAVPKTTVAAPKTTTVAAPKASVASSQATAVKSTPAVASTVSSQAAPASSVSQATVKSTPAVASTTSSVASSASSASSSVASQASSSSVASQTVQSSSQPSSAASSQASVASSASSVSNTASSASSSVASQASSSSVASQAVQSSTQQSSSVQNYAANNYAASNSSSRAVQPAATTNNQAANSTSSTANTNNNTQTQNTAAKTSSKASSASSTTRTGSGSNVVSYAESLIGVPYVYGGTTPSGFDCSGFVQYVYSHFGVNLPRTTTQQENCGTQIPVSQAQPGDLYFWGSKGSTYHVAIAIGGGKYVAAPEPGQSVSIGSTQYFQPSFAVRL